MLEQLDELVDRLANIDLQRADQVGFGPFVVVLLLFGLSDARLRGLGPRGQRLLECRKFTRGVAKLLLTLLHGALQGRYPFLIGRDFATPSGVELCA